MNAVLFIFLISKERGESNPKETEIVLVKKARKGCFATAACKKRDFTVLPFLHTKGNILRNRCVVFHHLVWVFNVQSVDNYEKVRKIRRSYGG